MTKIYDVYWCRENLFSPKKLEKYLQSDQYRIDVNRFAAYEIYTHIGKLTFTSIGTVICKEDYLTIYEKYELFKIIANNCSIENAVFPIVLHIYLDRISFFRCYTECVVNLIYYTKIVRLFVENVTLKTIVNILGDHIWLKYNEHFDVLNILFHAGVKTNVIHEKLSYFTSVFNCNSSSKSYFVHKKLLQTDVNMGEGEQRKHLLVYIKQNKTVEHTMVSALLIEFV